MITADDIRELAGLLVERHGTRALVFADQAVDELTGQGEIARADAWRALHAVATDILAGRLDPGRCLTLH